MRLHNYYYVRASLAFEACSNYENMYDRIFIFERSLETNE